MTTFAFVCREAIRSWRARPLTTAACIVIVALGVGSATAVSAGVYALLYRPLPLSDAGRLVSGFALREGFDPFGTSLLEFSAFRSIGIAGGLAGVLVSTWIAPMLAALNPVRPASFAPVLTDFRLDGVMLATGMGCRCSSRWRSRSRRACVSLGVVFVGWRGSSRRARVVERANRRLARAQAALASPGRESGDGRRRVADRRRPRAEKLRIAAGHAGWTGRAARPRARGSRSGARVRCHHRHPADRSGPPPPLTTPTAA